jgi:hypothetical protein
MLDSKAFLERIKSHINAHGYHVTTVLGGGPSPRFTYTIGLHEKFGFELAFAGGLYYSIEEVLEVIRKFVRRMTPHTNLDLLALRIPGLGSFSLQEIKPSWASKILLGVFDFYSLKRIKAFQIIPDNKHWTIDVPNMKAVWNPVAQPIWKWLDNPWRFRVSFESIAITNLDALKGQTITEVLRWEEREWEMFAGAGSDVDKSDLRMVPLGTMLAHDPTLKRVVSLKVGFGMWRDDQGLPWHPWGNGKN